jgi:MFS family permease
MKTNKKAARIVGVLFITATVAGIIGGVLLGPILDAPDYLAKVSANENQWLIGVLFNFIMAVAVAGIAIPMYPILKKHNEGMALGSVGFRIIEGALFSVGVISLLLLVPLSQKFVQAGAPDASYFQTLSELLVGVSTFSLLIGGLAFSLGALMYYYLLYQSKLIPRWLSLWGLFAVPLGSAAYLSQFFSASAFASASIDIGHLPIFFQEMVFAVWLIVKGFNPSAIVSGSAKQI